MIDIDAIRVRCRAATSGPWKAYRFGSWLHVCLDNNEDTKTCVAESGLEENAIFIAHARQDIPALLDYISDLESRLDALDDAYDELAFMEQRKCDYCERYVRK